MLIEVNTTWTVTSQTSSGRTVTGTGLAFDTATRQLGSFNQTRLLAMLDPLPPNVSLAAGELIWSECDGYTYLEYRYSGSNSVNVTSTPDSPSCGYQAPLTCKLTTVSVSQATTPTGVRVSVAYAGTVNGQVQYALDGGAEQASPVFAPVAAGAHTVQVRDDGLAGCVSSVTFTVAAPPAPLPAPTGPSQQVHFVGQPLWYSFGGQPPGALIELALWAESAHGAADFALVLRLHKRVNAQGRADFRLDPLLWPLLTPFVPTPTATTSRRTTNLLDYYVATTVTPLDPQQPIAYDVSDLRTAVRGGLPAEWQGTDYFAYRLGAAFALPPFLSWQPTGAGALAAGAAKAIDYAQPEWLFFLCPLALATSQLQVRRSYQMSLTGTAIADVEPLARPASWAHELLAIPLRATRPGFNFLTVQVEDDNGDPVSLPAVYQFVATKRPRYLVFTNSLGGLDTLRCAGEARLEYTLEATTEKVERPARPGEVADRQVSDLTASRKLKLATGWLLPAELDWVQELVLSREVWHQVGAQLRPLDWSKRSLVSYSDEPGLRGLLLECDYAYAPTAYAPTDYA